MVATGFKKFVRQNLTIQAAQTLPVNVTLDIGAATESVAVSAEATMLKTETGDISSNVNVETRSGCSIQDGIHGTSTSSWTGRSSNP